MGNGFYRHFSKEHKGYEYIRISCEDSEAAERAIKEVEATDKEFVIFFDRKNSKEYYLKHNGKTVDVSGGETEHWNMRFESLARIATAVNFHELTSYGSRRRERP